MNISRFFQNSCSLRMIWRMTKWCEYAWSEIFFEYLADLLHKTPFSPLMREVNRWWCEFSWNFGIVSYCTDALKRIKDSRPRRIQNEWSVEAWSVVMRNYCMLWYVVKRYWILQRCRKPFVLSFNVVKRMTYSNNSCEMWNHSCENTHDYLLWRFCKDTY